MYELYEVPSGTAVIAEIVFVHLSTHGDYELFQWTCPYCGAEQPGGYFESQRIGAPDYVYCRDCLQEWRWNPDKGHYCAMFDPEPPEVIERRQQERREYEQAVAEGREAEYIDEHWK